MKIAITILVLLFVCLGIYLIYNSLNSGAPALYPSKATSTSENGSSAISGGGYLATTSKAKSPATNVPIATTVNISMKNFAFSPSTLSVSLGTKIVWTNNDTVAHTVTSDSGNTFDSGPLSPGESFSYKFTNVGSVGYHCSIHPMMQGVIMVK